MCIPFMNLKIFENLLALHLKIYSSAITITILIFIQDEKYLASKAVNTSWDVAYINVQWDHLVCGYDKV